MAKAISVTEVGRRRDDDLLFAGVTDDWEFTKTILQLPESGNPEVFPLENGWTLLFDDRDADRFLGTGDFAT